MSIPPEVNLSLIDLPQTNVRGKSKDAPKVAVEVNGPLGLSSWSEAAGDISLIDFQGN